MVKYFITLVLFCSFAEARTFTAETEANNTVIAKVGNIEIRCEDFLRRYSNYIASTGIKDNLIVRQAILTNMINEEMLLHFDSPVNVKKNKNYVSDVEWIKNQTILAFLKDQEIYAKITVTDFELRQAFQRVNERIEARHLYARTEDEANNLFQLLKAGVDFKFLAKQVFSDSALKNNGGYLGFFTWGDMDPAFEEAAYSLNVDEISRPVKTEYGYSIIKIESRTTHPLLTETQFEQKRNHLERVMKIKKKKMYERDYFKNIFSPNEVVFNDINLKRLLNEFTHSTFQNIEVQQHKALYNCASYRGKSYSQKDLLLRLNTLPITHKEKIISLETMKSAIQGFFIQEKLMNIAHRKGYDTLSMVISEQKKARDAKFLAYKLQSIIDKAQISDSSAYQFYKDNAFLFTNENEVNVREIIVDSSVLADSLKEMVQRGVEFGKLAEQHSLRSWSAKNKGEMGLSPVSKFGALKDTLWNCAVGEVIGPIKIEKYYGLFSVMNKVKGSLQPFETVKYQAQQSLKIENQKAIVQEYLANLQKQVNITVNEQYLNSFSTAGVEFQK